MTGWSVESLKRRSRGQDSYSTAKKKAATRAAEERLLLERISWHWRRLRIVGRDFSFRAALAPLLRRIFLAADSQAEDRAFLLHVLEHFFLGLIELIEDRLQFLGSHAHRIQPWEYALRATGWVRVISGVQSLLSRLSTRHMGADLFRPMVRVIVGRPNP